jgi:arylsulfatase
MGGKVLPGPGDTYLAYGRGWANVSNTPFREYKHWVHEGGISTPLIVHWPNGISAKGELRNQPGHLIDIAATVYDLASATYPKDAAPLEGRSLVPALAGKPIEREAIYWEHEGNRAVRVGNWKIVAKHDQPWELYDIASDRVEANNLVTKHPQTVQDLRAMYDAWAKRAHVEPWPVNPSKKGK